jgi:hypothetical protein
MMVLTGPGAVTIPASTGTVFDTSTQRDVLFGGTAASQLIVAGDAGITDFGNTGSGTVIAGGGGQHHHPRRPCPRRRQRRSTIAVASMAKATMTAGAGGPTMTGMTTRTTTATTRCPRSATTLILTGAGDDRIDALSPATSPSARAAAADTIVLGTGTASVGSRPGLRHDIQAGTGAATINATGGPGRQNHWRRRQACRSSAARSASTAFGGSGAVTATGGVRRRRRVRGRIERR